MKKTRSRPTLESLVIMLYLLIVRQSQASSPYLLPSSLFIAPGDALTCLCYYEEGGENPSYCIKSGGFHMHSNHKTYEVMHDYNPYGHGYLHQASDIPREGSVSLALFGLRCPPCRSRRPKAKLHSFAFLLALSFQRTIDSPSLKGKMRTSTLSSS